MTDAGADLRFGIDRLVVSGRRLFGWGWTAHPQRAIREVHVRVRGDGWEKRLAAQSGILREDVAQAHPSLVGARFAGFVVSGYLPDSAIRDLSLETTYEGGESERFGLGTPVEVNETARAHRFTAGRIWRAFVRRLKSRDPRAFFRRPRADGRGLASLDEREGQEALVDALRDVPAIRVIFDHDMGGGANQYRRDAIARWNAQGEAAVLCTYHLPSLEYRVTACVPGRRERELRASSFVALEALLQDDRVAELFVNSPVSFDQPVVFAEWLARMKARRPGLRLTLTVHDYFAACPSFVLLNDQGRFCGVPDPAECDRCLGSHQAAHVALSPPTTIGPWREAWGRALAAADEVRCFSQASRELLTRAHPAADRASTTVLPHRIEFAPRLPAPNRAGALVIGVIGKLSVQKGARVVEEMARIIERERLDARIVVIGSLEVSFRSPYVEVTGTYTRDDLAGLVEKHGINMFFFPSIWPETFSYVVAEMSALGLPVVAFDLGAPAERLRAHPLARLVSRVDARAALDTLVEFHRSLAPGRAEAA